MGKSLILVQAERILELADAYAQQSYVDSNYGSNHAKEDRRKLKQYLDDITLKTAENHNA